MTRLYGMCILALLAFGLTVGCWDGVHRDARLDERRVQSRGREVTEVITQCECGRRNPYREIWR
jgi:hypothetical protein